MRIVLVTHFFPPTHNAGTENYTLGLAASLKNIGHEVCVICAQDWESGRRYWNGVSRDVYRDVCVYRIHLNWMKAARPNRVLYDSHMVEKWLDQFLIENSADIIHVTAASSLGVGILRSSKRARIPLALTLMDFWFICPRTVLMQGNGKLCEGMTSPWECQECLLFSSGLFKRTADILPDKLLRFFWKWISRLPLIQRIKGARGMALNMDERKLLMKRALDVPDVIVSHSRFVQNIFRKTGMSQRVIQLKNGHDLEWLQHYHSKIQSKHLRIGYLGQITYIKGIHILIEAFLKVRKPTGACLDIWGDADTDVEYVRMIKGFIGDSNSINLRGRFEHRELADIFSAIDVLVVPSLWYENAPLVIHEAFAAKVPVIASDLGGMSEVVSHEINGLLYKRGDSDDLSRQLQRILYESELLERLQNGIPEVKTIQEEALELESIYIDLINRRKE